MQVKFCVRPLRKAWLPLHRFHGARNYFVALCYALHRISPPVVKIWKYMEKFINAFRLGLTITGPISTKFVLDRHRLVCGY